MVTRRVATRTGPRGATRSSTIQSIGTKFASGCGGAGVGSTQRICLHYPSLQHLHLQLLLGNRHKLPHLHRRNCPNFAMNEFRCNFAPPKNRYSDVVAVGWTRVYACMCTVMHTYTYAYASMHMHKYVRMVYLHCLYTYILRVIYMYIHACPL